MVICEIEHLFFLNWSYSKVRIKDIDLNVFYFRKGRKDGTSGISGCCRQYLDAFLFRVFFLSCLHQIGEKRKSHIFEGQSVSVEKLHERKTLEGSDIHDFFFKMIFVIGFIDVFSDFLISEIIEVETKYFKGDFLIAQGKKIFVYRQHFDSFGKEETSIIAKALKYRLGCHDFLIAISCAEEHSRPPLRIMFI